jgi:hypothetical protein
MPRFPLRTLDSTRIRTGPIGTKSLVALPAEGSAPLAPVPAGVTTPSPLPGQHAREMQHAAGHDAVTIHRRRAARVAAETPLPQRSAPS